MKIGIFIDAENIRRCGGYAMKYDVLKEYCSLGNIPLRLNTYLADDEERRGRDDDYNRRYTTYLSIIRSFGFKIVTKKVKFFVDVETGDTMSKANSDLDMAVDILLQSDNLDKIYMLTGDGDFCKVVQAVQNKGTRVEVIAFNNVARELRYEADSFTSGHLIPNLVPIKDQREEDWGKHEFRTRGICYSINPEKKFGFIRFMDANYQYKEAIFFFNALPRGHFVSHEDIFECKVVKSDKGYTAFELESVG